MRRLAIGLALLAANIACAQTVIGPNTYKMREIQYDLQGNSMVPRINPFPDPGIKCVRLLDGDLKTTTGPSCATLGPSFTVDSNYVINATGVQGPQGATGATGQTGATGPQGVKGDPGTTDWYGITNKPTTLAGFGITDAVSQTALSSSLSNYATTSSLSTYATTASLSNYATTASLANYATTSALSSGLAGKYAQPTGTTAQYIRGDGSLATLDAYPASTNPANYLTSISSAQVTTALGFTPLTQAGARSAISLTTTGSGAATYNSATGAINVPTPQAAQARVFEIGRSDRIGFITTRRKDKQLIHFVQRENLLVRLHVHEHATRHGNAAEPCRAHRAPHELAKHSLGEKLSPRHDRVEAFSMKDLVERRLNVVHVRYAVAAAPHRLAVTGPLEQSVQPVGDPRRRTALRIGSHAHDLVFVLERHHPLKERDVRIEDAE